MTPPFLSLLDTEDRIRECGPLLAGDLDLLRAWLRSEAYPVDSATRAAFSRLVGDTQRQPKQEKKSDESAGRDVGPV